MGFETMVTQVAVTQQVANPTSGGKGRILLGGGPEEAAEALRGFCPDPVLFPALGSVLAKAGQALEDGKTRPLCLADDDAERQLATTMGACYPKCMGASGDQPVLPGMQARRKQMDVTTEKSTRMYATNQSAEETTEILAAKMKTFDLEELGLTAARHSKEKQDAEQQTLKSIVVDYEDSDGEHPTPREDTQTCAPSACGPLDGAPSSSIDGLLSGDNSNNVGSAGRLTRRRSRRSSSTDMVSAPAPSSLRGKSVIFEKDVKTVEPASPGTSDTEAEEEPARCCKVHKLCMCEVQLHRSVESCWLVASDQVYDVTGLVNVHPGGSRSILRKAGGPDCTKDMKFHTKKARKMLEKCFIGKLQPCGEVDSAGEANCSIM
ncbi:hypothetical protein BBJ28_00012734 [Nothophytophthora sp. Chile5]|nr:hypothetical protein BBJ28_00012734 [Nothophytophthora sp. Chile5]